MQRLLFALGGACLLLRTEYAHGEEPRIAGHGSVASLLGYGFKDGLNLGLGVRGGYTSSMNLYVGGLFAYHLGKSDSFPLGDVSTHLSYFGVEGGYDIKVDPIVIRPYLGLGAALVTVGVPGRYLDAPGAAPGAIAYPATSEMSTRFGVWPGVVLIYPIGKAFVGGDARFLIVPDFNSLSLFATGGLQF